MLLKGQIVAGKYETQFKVSESPLCSVYRVKGTEGNIFRLHLYNLAKQPRQHFNENNSLFEIEIFKTIRHTNICRRIDSSETVIGNQKYSFIVFEFVSGESLLERLKREGSFSPYSAVPIVIELCSAVHYLHTLPEPIIHNSINPSTVLLDLSEKREKPILTGFEFARTINQSGKSISLSHISLFHSASELFNGIFILQSDVFAMGALLYHLIFGIPPWYIDLPNTSFEKTIELILNARNKPLNFSLTDESLLDDHLKNTIAKALATDTDERFESVEEFVKALKREVIIEGHEIKTDFTQRPTKKKFSSTEKGKGFDLIAGMDELKDILFNDVIRPITEPERFARFGIPLLNGMMLYGPPGCGKTFIAEKFAEEVGFNFISIKPSDLGSIYAHGGQEKIGKLFKEAETKSPCIIFMDEIDAIVPSREGDISHHYAGEVNEMLAQLSNCGEKGIFIIAATNRPEKIDTAILRTGRIDKTVYLPPPDKKAREAMFKLYLKTRPTDLAVDCERLADLTPNYVSSDLKFLIIEASKVAERTTEERITMKIFEDVIMKNKPSVTLKELKKYEALKEKWDKAKQGIDENERTWIGFKPRDENE